MESTPPSIKERAFAFAVRVVALCRKLDETRGTPRALSNQLLRFGTSVGANIEEAQGSQSKADFTAKMYIACKESRETNYGLRLLVATDMLPERQLAALIDESNQLVAILTVIVKKSKLT